MEEKLFNELYEKYHGMLFQFLFYMVRSREQAEDLVQEVYIRVWKAHGKFEGKSSEKTWLFAIARNVAIDYFRQQQSLKRKAMMVLGEMTDQVKDTSPLPEEIAEEREEIRLVYSSLNQCTVDQRMVMILRYQQELTIAETAEALHWTEGKVKTTQHRALKKLKNFMSGGGGQSPLKAS
ncbi:sigma-70 family RNA polymerase sigma factor [Bacillus sp. FJAT-27251]|uniref:sigma-70 family RNA polymerase sigma factor n=1 Tax=Bacillus sp. FJAT-27251 TaxID=1684142 RepID=UPI0006A7CB8E|nr:sigma-70 family RNA polymerase sigma factor [Bacillus sp. FJAT-27251]